MADTEIAGLVVQMKADLSDYVTKLAQMESKTNQTGDNVKSSLGTITTTFTKLGVVVAGFTAGAVKSAMDWGTSIKSLSRQTGMTAEDTSKFLVVAKRAGIDIDSSRMMFAKFAVNVTQAGQEMARASAKGEESNDVFTRLGVAVENSDGSYRNVNEIFSEVRDKLARMQDGAEKTSIQMDLFGRSGYQLAGIMGMTREEMQQTIDKAKTLGLILSDEQANAWAKAGKEIKDVKQSLTAIGITIGNELLPYIKEVTTDVSGTVKAFSNMDSQTKETIMTVVKIAAELGGFIWATDKIIGMAGSLRLALMNPWIGVPVLIGAAVLALRDYSTAANRAARAKRELEGNPFVPADIAQGLGPSPADLKRSEDTNTKPKWGEEPPDNTPYVPRAVSIPSNNGSKEKEKTELQAYTEEMQKLIAIWEKEVELGQLSKEQFQGLLQERLAGLSAVSVGSDEFLTKQQEELNLMLQIRQSGEQSRQKAIEDAQQQQQLGNITNDQLAESIVQQYQLAETDQERIKILLQLKNVYNDLKKAADEYYDAVIKSQEEDAQRIDKEFQTQIRQVSELVEKQQQAAKKTKNAWDDVFVGILSGDVDGKSIGKSLQRELANLLVKGESTLFGVSKKSTTKVDGFTDDQNKALQTFIGTIGVGTDAMTILNGVTQILGMTTKPVETAATTASTAAKIPETTATVAHTAATTASTVAITAMSAAAAVAAAALASVGGGQILGLFEGGGIVPSAAGGMITGDSGFGARNNIPAVLHPREMVLPKNISSMFIDLAQTYRANTGGRRQYNSINIYNAQNLNEDKLVSKLGRRINNLQRGRR